VDFFEVCCNFIHARLQGGVEYATFQENLPVFKCFTKCSRVKLGGTIFNGPPRFIQKLHSEVKEASIARSMECSGATGAMQGAGTVHYNLFSADIPVTVCLRRAFLEFCVSSYSGHLNVHLPLNYGTCRRCMQRGCQAAQITVRTKARTKNSPQRTCTSCEGMRERLLQQHCFRLDPRKFLTAKQFFPIWWCVSLCTKYLSACCALDVCCVSLIGAFIMSAL
jgi:hypothetical protein